MNCGDLARTTPLLSVSTIGLNVYSIPTLLSLVVVPPNKTLELLIIL